MTILVSTARRPPAPSFLPWLGRPAGAGSRTPGSASSPLFVTFRLERTGSPGRHRGGTQGQGLVPEVHEHVFNARPLQEVHRLFKLVRVAVGFPGPLATELPQLRKGLHLLVGEVGQVHGNLMWYRE